MTETETIEIEKVLSREIFEDAQVTRLLKKFCKGTEQPITVLYSGESGRVWSVFVNGYSFSGETLFAALESANPFLESLHR